VVLLDNRKTERAPIIEVIKKQPREIVLSAFGGAGVVLHSLPSSSLMRSARGICDVMNREQANGLNANVGAEVQAAEPKERRHNVGTR
jgi:hypothetical protein